MYKLDLENTGSSDFELPTSSGLSKKQESSRKTFGSLITTNCGKFLAIVIPDHLTCLLRNQLKKQQLEPDMEQWTDSKLGKEYVKAVFCHPVYLTSVQSTS